MPDRRPSWAGDPIQVPGGNTGRQAYFSDTPRTARVSPKSPTPEEARAFYSNVGKRPYRRATPGGADEEGFVWIEPSATAWPNVRGNPPGPRSQRIGYNREERVVRCVFRNGKRYRYEQVPPEVWERIRRTASTGRFINRVLNGYPYEPDD